MSEKKEEIEILKKMIREKRPKEPVEKVLVFFCAHTGVSLDTCTEYYQFLVDSGEIEETDSVS